MSARRIIFRPFILLAIAVLFIAGCATMETHWERAKAGNTIKAYEEFLESYPEGNFADEARSSLEKLYLEQAKTKDSIKDYENFLEKYPKSKYSDEVLCRLEKLRKYEKEVKKEFDNAQKSNTVQSYSYFIGSYPKSELANDAINKLLNLLKEQFPPNYKMVNVSRGNLINSISNNQGYLVGFVPVDIVCRGNKWTVTVHFVEVGGEPVIISRLVPSCRGKAGAFYKCPNGLDRDIVIQPFGRTSHSFWWETAPAILSSGSLKYYYSSESGDKERQGNQIEFDIECYKYPFFYDSKWEWPPKIEKIEKTTFKLVEKDHSLIYGEPLLDMRCRTTADHEFPWQFCFVDIDGLASMWRDAKREDIKHRRLSYDELLELEKVFQQLPSSSSHCENNLELRYGNGSALDRREYDLFALPIGAKRLIEIVSASTSDATNIEKRKMEIADLNVEAIYLRDLTVYDQATKKAQKALDIAQEEFGPDSREVTMVLNTIVSIYLAQKEYAEAKSLCEKTIKIRNEDLDEPVCEIARSINNVAKILELEGRYAESEQLYKKALEMLTRTVKSENHPSMAELLNNFGDLYKSQGKYTEAKIFYERAWNNKPTVFGKKHPVVVESACRLANLYETQKKYSDAVVWYEKALEINGSGRSVDVMNKLAELCRKIPGQEEKAKKYKKNEQDALTIELFQAMFDQH